MDFTSLLNNVVEAAPGVAAAITGKQATPTAATVKETPVSATEAKATAQAQAKSWIPWAIGGGVVLILGGIFLLKK